MTLGDDRERQAAVRARSRRRDPIAELARAPHRHDFYQALRRIDALHRELPTLGTARRPQDEPVRLGQDAELSFAPTTLAALNPADRIGKPRIAVRFFGLFGPNGPLPLHLTAFARERVLHHHDETLTRFADVFHHRLLLLFYRAWAQAQPAVSLDRPETDRYADFVGSLFGTGGPEWRGRAQVPTHATLFFSGLLARQVRNADGLATMLSADLARAVRVEPFVGRWLRLPPAERSMLGWRTLPRRDAAARLGANVVAGGTVFDRQHQFRVHIGPLTLDEFESLLPPGIALPRLRALVLQYVGHELGWDLALELRAEERPRARLGRRTRLGWTSWLGAARPGAPAPRLLLNPDRT
jgi:type VI secretion system protein ImpH